MISNTYDSWESKLSIQMDRDMEDADASLENDNGKDDVIMASLWRHHDVMKILKN